MRLAELLPILIPFTILAIICFVIAFYISKLQKKLKIEEDKNKEQEKYFSLLPDELIRQYNARAAYLCQSKIQLFSIPPGVFCYLLALDDALVIIADTQPQTIFRLAYAKFVKFQAGKAKKKAGQISGALRLPVMEEHVHIFIEYRTEEGINQLQFISGITEEDKWFNEAAIKITNFIEFIIAQLPEQNKPIIL